MNFVILAAVGGFVVLLAALRYVRYRKERAEAKRIEDVAAAIQQVEAEVQQLRASEDDAISGGLKFVEGAIARARVSADFDHFQRAAFHRELAAIGCRWLRFHKQESERFESNMAVVRKVYADLMVGLTLLRDGKFALADQHLERLWTDSGDTPYARVLALQAKILSLRAQGQNDEATGHEILLNLLPVLMDNPDIDVTYKVT